MARILSFTGTRPASGLRLGDVLVESGAVARAQVEAALADQQTQDSLLGHILLVGGHISQDDLARALSAQSGLRQVDLERDAPDPELLASADPYLCLALEAVPWRRQDGRIDVAVANPATAASAIDAFGDGRAGVVLAQPAAIRAVIHRTFGERLAADALVRCPDAFSCRTLVSRRATWRKILFSLALVAGVVAAPVVALHVALLWIVIASTATMALRLVALVARWHSGKRPVSAVPRIVDSARLPRVSILVPLWREERVAEQLLAALSAMDYPAPLLDIKLVLEEEDDTTRAAILRHPLPPTIEVVTVPRDVLRTKPRAMNYALPFCRGEIVGVYDAEDCPDPGQLRAVVQHLADAPSDVACVQGYLDFYNHAQNWLARCFTIEYAVWFRVQLAGIERLGIPIPLGGTTVFFRRSALEDFGAWDAHNVTEDADLGMRLARFGYRCEMIATTTLEEANAASPREWVGQRSRWLKGYAITWASHMRDPIALWRDLGWRGFLGFQILFLGGLTAYLAVPVFWLLWSAFLGLDLGVWDQLSAPLMYGFATAMLVGQGVTILSATVALRDCGRLRLLPWLATLPLYWVLGALAAYRAIAEVFYRPFYWRKTAHGHAMPAPAPSRDPRSR